MAKKPAESPATSEGPAPADQPQAEEQAWKTCFVIAPIGEFGSPERSRTTGLLAEVIRPVLKALRIKATAAHEMDALGSITGQIVRRLLTDDLVIADLTGLNANVMYELAIRHYRGTPVVCLAEERTTLPFDIKAERTIFYRENFLGIRSLKRELKSKVVAALKDGSGDNPVTRGKKGLLLEEQAETPDILKEIYKMLQDQQERTAERSRPSLLPLVSGAGAAEGVSGTLTVRGELAEVKSYLAKLRRVYPGVFFGNIHYATQIKRALIYFEVPVSVSPGQVSEVCKNLASKFNLEFVEFKTVAEVP